MTNLETRNPCRVGEDAPADADLLARWCVGNDTEALDTLIRDADASLYERNRHMR